MLDTALVATLELLTSSEQKAILAVAEYLRSHRNSGTDPRQTAEAVLAELSSADPRFTTPDEALSPARKAARRFMRENPSLMRLLAQ